MTKAELFHRFRWVLLILPLATVAGYRVLWSLMRELSPLPVAISWLSSAMHAPVEVVLGWVFITFVCSGQTAYSAAERSGLTRGMVGFIMSCIATIGVFVFHVGVCSVFLNFFPFH